MSTASKPTRSRARAKGERPAKADWPKFIESLSAMPVVAHACRAAGLNRSSAFTRRTTHPEFAAEWDAAIEHGLDGVELVMHQLALGTYVQADPEAEPPNPEMIKLVMRARRRELYGLAIEVRGQKSLAELRALPDAEFAEIVRRMGLIPQDGGE